MGNRQHHPAQDKAEIGVHTSLRLFDILMSKDDADPDVMAVKAKEISDKFTDGYDD